MQIKKLDSQMYITYLKLQLPDSTFTRVNLDKLFEIE